MADFIISEFTLLDGKTVEIKDAVARAAIQGGSYFLGVTTTEITDGSTVTQVSIPQTSGDPKLVTVVNGNVVAYGNKEFIYASADAKWHELGDLTNLGDLALKDAASALYTPAGTVEFTGAAMNASGSYTPEGSVNFSGATVNASGSYTPEGSVSFSGATVNASGSYTPAGTVTKPDVTVTPTTESVDVFATAGSVTAGVAASATLPTWNATVVGERLVFSWDQGAFTANTPTVVTLPTSSSISVMTNASAALAAAPTFNGTAATIDVAGTAAGSATFSGTAATIDVAGTAAGSATFSGTAATIEVEGTTTGSATFSGTQATITVS